MPQSRDPTREIAKIALRETSYVTDVLEEVIEYAFEQLCWTCGDARLQVLVDNLRLKLVDEGET